MPTVQLINHKTFAAQADTPILESARQAGLVLEHSCRTGRCGSCKTQVLQGESRVLLHEDALSDNERREGWILSCARGAVSDMRLDIADLGALAEITTKTLPCRIDSMQRLAPDVMQVVLRLPPKAQLHYLSGQYINVIALDGQRRSYSMANAASPSGRIELHIRQVDQGVLSQYWFNSAKPGDLLRLEGPLGTFYLRDVAGADLVFLASGTGLAPIKAMLESLQSRAAAQQPRSTLLLWGGRTPSDLYWQPDFSGLDYTPVLSRADDSWRGARGHVQHVLLGSARDWSRTLVYACGSNNMIHSAHASLLQAGLPPKQFYSDAFVSSASAQP